jgi:hypothetical protein
MISNSGPIKALPIRESITRSLFTANSTRFSSNGINPKNKSTVYYLLIKSDNESVIDRSSALSDVLLRGSHLHVC